MGDYLPSTATRRTTAPTTIIQAVQAEVQRQTSQVKDTTTSEGAATLEAAQQSMLMCWGNAGDVAGGATAYLVYGNGTAWADEVDGKIIVNRAGVIRDFVATAEANTCNAASSLTIGVDGTYSVQRSFAATATTSTAVATTPTSKEVVAGDYISVKLIAGGAGNITDVKASFTFEATA